MLVGARGDFSGMIAWCRANYRSLGNVGTGQGTYSMKAFGGSREIGSFLNPAVADRAGLISIKKAMG